MAGLIAKPPKLLAVQHDDSSTDTDSDDDLSLCDLPIRGSSPASFPSRSPSAAMNVANTGANRRLPVLSVPSQAPPPGANDGNDPFEFFGARHASGMCSPSAVFNGGRMLPTQAPAPSTSISATGASQLLASTAYSTSRTSSDSNPANSGVLPPLPMSRRSRSEAVRRPPRDPAAYNRSASVEARGAARRVGLGPAGRKGDYRRLPPMPGAVASSASFGSSGSSKRSTTSGGGGGGQTCIVDAVPSCGPRPKWYVFATFATVKPPQGEMDMKDIRTRQKKRSTQQQQQPADSSGSNGGARPPAPGVIGAGLVRGRKSWLLNSLSCRVDVDAHAWSPSHPPMPLPELPNNPVSSRWRY